MMRQLEKSKFLREPQFSSNVVLIKGHLNQVLVEMRQEGYFVPCNDSIQFNLLSEQIGLGEKWVILPQSQSSNAWHFLTVKGLPDIDSIRFL